MGRRLPLVLGTVILMVGLVGALPNAGATQRGGLDPRLDTRAEALQWIRTHGYLPLHGIDSLERAKAHAAAVVAARTGRPVATPTSQGDAPIVGASWQGLNSLFVSPADPNGAIGPNSYVEI